MADPRVTTSYGAIVGCVLRSRRLAAKISQHHLAVNLGLTQSALSRLETGVMQWTVDQLRAAAGVLGTSAGEITNLADAAAKVLRKQGVLITDVFPVPRRCGAALRVHELDALISGVLVLRRADLRAAFAARLATVEDPGPGFLAGGKVRPR